MLPACGFQPVYSKKHDVSQNSPIHTGVKVSASASGNILLSNNNSIDNSNATMARQFTYDLEDLLNSKDEIPQYRLEVALTQSNIGIGVARDGTASRYNLVINSGYKLIRLSDNKEVDNGSISNVTSYNNPNNKFFSTYISEQDARKRGISELAELYRQRLIAFTEKTKPSSLPLSTPPPLNENCPQSS